MIQKHELPILEYDSSSEEVIKPNHGAEQLMDFLISCGCRKIISTGSCGVLTDLAENEFLIPVKALRDEGTSYHYLPASRYIELDKTIRDAIEQTLLAQKIPFRECITWTTDGFFRETQDMVKYRRAEGCTTVEMECAALAACARKQGASFGQILYTADSLANVLEHDERDWGKELLAKSTGTLHRSAASDLKERSNHALSCYERVGCGRDRRVLYRLLQSS